ncbi:Yip1-domain-containing protein [Eremomyces bilateralis CBS 781.70]|uniref:Yip1-domain-containing protein n=1 Tax=Eremomyces bilateralis CBS 781.70 TaxID=1392243 RepID=A0A6G1G4M0_9PEZI|nr:Yip1-domain-containing protein [Eremomyces bilateralis CBS 781.70]KAF1812891.1 Yip1-domain-containing protein [Eremomyces bilateralis CBS 781.70]
MSQYYPPNYSSSNNPQNLQFYPSSYNTGPSPGHVSGHSTPFQASYPGGSSSSAFPGSSYGASSSGFSGAAFGAPPGVSGRMGEQGGLRTGWLAAFSTEGYETEPPLLEELGVNFGHIKTKTLTVLNPFAPISHHLMDDSDLAGPLLFALLFGFFLRASGKTHFSYIYGLSLLGSTSLHVILSLMSPPPSTDSTTGQPPYTASASHYPTPDPSKSGSSHFASTLTYARSASVLGYCMLPLVLVSALGVVVSMSTFTGYIITSAAILWCVYSSSAIFVAVGRMEGMRGLVAYPLALFYMCFGIMAIFGASSASGAKGTAGTG